ncbi:MAG TPA: dihydrodipicolinate synthase family protein [Candidatus Polarisedimenticolia bacterium]|nr:dihydrodipicolinate synthase family protein [Candidatus Polarisedimenticolia bacterium]
MTKRLKYGGAVVPMVTPFMADGTLDEAALQRLVEAQVAGGVEGVFVLGTTGEGANVPRELRRKLVAQTVKHVNRRALVFAGLGDVRDGELCEANEFFEAGADAVVAHPPISDKVTDGDLLAWYQKLLDCVQGPLVLYNMPMTTRVSIPLDTVEKLIGHPKVAGIKDSENNPQRLEEMLGRCGGKKDFSVFVGVGALMEKGLKLGADGVVPSVGNLIPHICHKLCAAAKKKDWAGVENFSQHMNTIAALYQKGRTLNESLSALKAALACRGLCLPHMRLPLNPLTESQMEKLRHEMERLHLLNGM